ncbi:MAG: hypothetical protein H6746_18540 [Deltaproteobacteria bacterium]|nr:hypothetical protein [Deltaproteobacteria bacterium]
MNARRRGGSSGLGRAALGGLLWWVASALTGACETPQSGSSSTVLPELRVESAAPKPVLPGTRLRVRGAGFVGPEVASFRVRLEGTRGGVPVRVDLEPLVFAPDEMVLPVDASVAAALVRDGEHFTGELVLERTPRLAGPVDTVRLALDFDTRTTLEPRLDGAAPLELRPGSALTLSGDGFLHPAEGLSLVAFDGAFTTDAPAVVTEIHGLQVPAAPPDALRRDALELTMTPDIFGVRPGTFVGSLTVHNVANTQPEPQVSAPLSPGPLSLRRPVIDALTPLSASRGQRVEVQGDGLLPPDGLLQAGTLLVLEGRFTPRRGAALDLTGVNALALFPDEHPDNRSAAFVLRVSTDTEGHLTGLGQQAGVFEGVLTPLVFSGSDTVLGEGIELTFTVGAPRQWVWLNFLPTFDDALALFGLEAERDAVIARILAVTARDYAGVNVAFATTPPEQFDEYAIVEIGAEDPNGTHLFGLDNTAGKDVGNRRFDDVIGGFNADTRARGFAAFGGIFPAEMLSFSPRLGDSPLTSARFDDIFGELAPPLGGVAAGPGEAQAGGDRGQVIAEAVRVLGNLIGSTISHEVGHSLGLAAVDGLFHNAGDNPGWLMDAGIFRPFEERAELDGQGPSFFSPNNRDYLEQILPESP